MSRSATLSREHIIASGLAVTAFYSARSNGTNSAKKKEQFVVFSKITSSNEVFHGLTVFQSAKKSGPNDAVLYSVQITRDNLCGIINDTECPQLSSRAAVKQACPYLAVVTKTGTLEIRQKDGSHSSTKNHDTWFRSLKQELNFDHSWPVQLESSSPTFPQHSESSKAFLCLNHQTVSVVFAANYTCILCCSTTNCRFRAQSQANHVLITIKQLNLASENKCVVRAHPGIAKGFLGAVGYEEIPLYITPGFHEADLPMSPSPSPAPSSSSGQPWLLRDTFTEILKGNKPEPDTMKLSLSCVIHLSINLVNTTGQPCWRELAELLGMSLDDIDMIIRWTCSRYNTPRLNSSVTMLPAMCLFYHWQYVYNVHGVGKSHGTSRPCNKMQLRSLLSTIGRNDLVNLLDEWEASEATAITI